MPSAAVLGGGRAVGALILAGPDLPAPALLGGDAALMPLAGPGLLASAVGKDIRQVRAALDPLCERAAAVPVRTVSAGREVARDRVPAAQGPV